MARYVMSVRTPMAPADAFAYLSDLSNFDEWDPGVSRAEQVSGDGPGEGAIFELDASGTTLRYEVEAFDPPRMVRAVARSTFITSVDTITVEPDEGTPGSIVTYDADLTLNGLLRLGDPFLKLAFGRIGDRAAKGLTEQLDGQRIR
jgi:hypothetical protein